jgi:hypothetical protein
MNETFEQFCERMGKVEKSEELVIGRVSSGNTRSTFDFEGHDCHLESFGYRCIPEGRKLQGNITISEMLWVASGNPSDEWVHGAWVKGKSAAHKLAAQYGGKARPDEYHEDDKDAWYIRFCGDDAFEKLMKMIYDYKTGVLPAEAFPWKAGLL